MDLQKTNGIMKYLFDFGPVSIPIPELREKIEFKIMQEFFIHSNALPEEFKFANYMCLVLKEYIVSLVEVRPISWLFLSSLVALNYGRITIIDPKYQFSVCRSYLERQGNDYDSSACPEYTLRYVLVCSALMALYIFAVLFASEIYIRGLIDKILVVEETVELFEMEEGDSSAAVPASDVGVADNISSQISAAFDSSETAILNTDKKPVQPHFRRRHLYFKCLQRIMDIELDYYKTTAQRSSPRRIELSRNDSQTSLSTPKASAWTKSLSSKFLPSSRPTSTRISINSERSDNLFELASIEAEAEKRNLLRSQSLQRSQSANVRAFRQGLIRLQTHSADKHNIEELINKSHSSGSPSGSGDVQDSANETKGLRGDYSKLPVLSPSTSNESVQEGNRMHTIEDIKICLKKRNSERLRLKNMSSPSVAAPDDYPVRKMTEDSKDGPNRNSFRWSKRLFPPFAEEKSPQNEKKNEDSYFPRHIKQSSPKRRRYSLEFFDMHQTLEQYREQAEKEKKKKCSSLVFMRITSSKDLLVSFSQSIKVAFGWLLARLLHKEDSKDVAGNIKNDQDAFSDIFLFRSPLVYFLTVELALLVQCVYIALWATNFVVIAQQSDKPAFWQFVLLLPLPMNFFLLKQIIFTSSLLKAVVKLDKDIADKICEEAIDVRNVTQRLREAVRSSLIKEFPQSQERMIFVRKKFHQSSKNDSQHRANEKSFQDFLHSLKLYFTSSSVSKIFGIIDFDNDGWVSWSDLRPILFPELQQKKLTITTRQSVVAKGRLSFEYRRDNGEEDDDEDDDDEGGVSQRPARQQQQQQQPSFFFPAKDHKFYLTKVFGNSAKEDSEKDEEGDSTEVAGDGQSHENSPVNEVEDTEPRDSFRLVLPSNFTRRREVPSSAGEDSQHRSASPARGKRVSFQLADAVQFSRANVPSDIYESPVQDEIEKVGSNALSKKPFDSFYDI